MQLQLFPALSPSQVVPGVPQNLSCSALRSPWGQQSRAEAGLGGMSLSPVTDVTLGTPHPIPAAPPLPTAFLQGFSSPGTRLGGPECWGAAPAGGSLPSCSIQAQRGQGERREEPAGPGSRSGDSQARGETEPSGAGGTRPRGQGHPGGTETRGTEGPEGHGAGQRWEGQRGEGRKVLGNPGSPGS